MPFLLRNPIPIPNPNPNPNPKPTPIPIPIFSPLYISPHGWLFALTSR